MIRLVRHYWLARPKSRVEVWTMWLEKRPWAMWILESEEGTAWCWFLRAGTTSLFCFHFLSWITFCLDVKGCIFYEFSGYLFLSYVAIAVRCLLKELHYLRLGQRSNFQRNGNAEKIMDARNPLEENARRRLGMVLVWKGALDGRENSSITLRVDVELNWTEFFMNNNKLNKYNKLCDIHLK